MNPIQSHTVPPGINETLNPFCLFQGQCVFQHYDGHRVFEHHCLKIRCMDSFTSTEPS